MAWARKLIGRASAGQCILCTEGTLPQRVVIKEDVIVITGRALVMGVSRAIQVLRAMAHR